MASNEQIAITPSERFLSERPSYSMPSLHIPSIGSDTSSAMSASRSGSSMDSSSLLPQSSTSDEQSSASSPLSSAPSDLDDELHTNKLVLATKLKQSTLSKVPATPAQSASPDCAADEPAHTSSVKAVKSMLTSADWQTRRSGRRVSAPMRYSQETTKMDVVAEDQLSQVGPGDGITLASTVPLKRRRYGTLASRGPSSSDPTNRPKRSKQPAEAEATAGTAAKKPRGRPRKAAMTSSTKSDPTSNRTARGSLIVSLKLDFARLRVDPARSSINDATTNEVTSKETKNNEVTTGVRAIDGVIGNVPTTGEPTADRVATDEPTVSGATASDNATEEATAPPLTSSWRKLINVHSNIFAPSPFKPIHATISNHSSHELLDMSLRLARRLPINQKPLPIGSPSVWASDRQPLCEALQYYKSYQGACYMKDGLVFTMMLDENGHERDFMDEDVIISRAGGGMARNKDGELLQVKAQSDNPQSKAMRHNLDLQIPILVICGDKNSICPTKMPHRYCVLGWYKVTDIVPGKGRTQKANTLQYRFEKLNSNQQGWWAPETEKPVVNLGQLPPPSQHACQTCGETHEQVYMKPMCLTPSCPSYWKLADGSAPQTADTSNFNPCWLKKRTRWADEVDPFDFKPEPFVPERKPGAEYTYENTRGLCCPLCGMCSSRYKFEGWVCDNQTCDFRIDAPRIPITPDMLRDRAHPLGKGCPISYDRALPFVQQWYEYMFSHRVHYFAIPGLQEDIIIHMIANQRALEEPRGPDDMWMALQAQDIGLERRFLQTGKAFGRMQAFSVNHGFPYKFVGTVPSQPFTGAAWPITETRTQLNFMSKMVLQGKFPEKAYNELLTFAYMENQKIKYHDDGETGLGPTVATYSLGSSAIMRFRLKKRYHRGFVEKNGNGQEVHEDDEGGEDNDAEEHESEEHDAEHKTESKAKQDNKKYPYFINEAPIPHVPEYDFRLEAFKSLGDLSPSDKDKRCREIGEELQNLMKSKRNKTHPPVITLHISHGDKIIMHGESIQKYYEHEVTPFPGLRFANTCREILPHHLPKDQLPADGSVPPDTGEYDGSNLL